MVGVLGESITDNSSLRGDRTDGWGLGPALDKHAEQGGQGRQVLSGDKTGDGQLAAS